MMISEKKTQSEQIDDIFQFLDERLHPIVSPEHWDVYAELHDMISSLSSAQPEHLMDDDFETIRIHLNAYKGALCNQHRWEEAEEYQRIIDRFMAFASVQPEQRWIPVSERLPEYMQKVLISTKQDRVHQGRYNGEENIHKWYSFVDRTALWNHDVIAWSPLPEPYKKGETNG